MCYGFFSGDWMRRMCFCVMSLNSQKRLKMLDATPDGWRYLWFSSEGLCVDRRFVESSGDWMRRMFFCIMHLHHEKRVALGDARCNPRRLEMSLVDFRGLCDDRRFVEPSGDCLRGMCYCVMDVNHGKGVR